MLILRLLTERKKAWARTDMSKVEINGLEDFSKNQFRACIVAKEQEHI